VKAAFELAGEPRAQLGRTSARRLRKAGKVPAIMYGGGEAPESLVLDHNTLKHQMAREAFYTSILTLKLGAKAQQVVVKAVERHPARPIIMHMDFQRVREDVEITLNVPVHFLNEAEAKGVKDQGGVVNHILTDVEVRCLPRFLPEYLEIDVTPLELNQMFHLSDIKLPEGVKSATRRDVTLVTVVPPSGYAEELRQAAQAAAQAATAAAAAAAAPPAPTGAPGATPAAAPAAGAAPAAPAGGAAKK